MIMQKKGFLLFLCSLIPGAGELYMGFKKRGVSMMAIFWGIVALTCVSGLEWFALALPVVWAYSFFQVHNLKSLPEEVFYLQKDEYAFHFDYVLEHKREMLKKYRVVIAAVCILLGGSVLFHTFGDILYYLLPFGGFICYGKWNDKKCSCGGCLFRRWYLPCRKQREMAGFF